MRPCLDTQGTCTLTIGSSSLSRLLKKKEKSIQMTNKLIPKSTMRRRAAEAVFDELLGSDKGKRFRLSDLSALLYPLTSPRSHDLAKEHANYLIGKAARARRVKRSGHLHWEAIEISSGRKLVDGRTVPEVAELRKLTLTTHCVGKWAAIDLETGEIYEGAPTGWRKASPASMESLQVALAAAAG